MKKRYISGYNNLFSVASIIEQKHKHMMSSVKAAHANDKLYKLHICNFISCIDDNEKWKPLNHAQKWVIYNYVKYLQFILRSRV
jgi:hypothetical protein